MKTTNNPSCQHGGARNGAGRPRVSKLPVVTKTVGITADQERAISALPSVPRTPGFSGKLRRVIDAGLAEIRRVENARKIFF